MSYARWGADGSDVYVFGAEEGLECHGCRLAGEHMDDNFVCLSTAEMVEHLREHQKAGHIVPAGTFVHLIDDREENDAEYLTNHPQ